ncbi:MAG: polysaccharide biosynthesis protein [Alphaproteobacteria bacterium]|nr:polysaccharide biosynthesis protein [Alphaproteobacteria bacterium]
MSLSQHSQSFFAGAVVAVTGGAGTVGRELIAQMLRLPVKQVLALDSDENGLFFLSSDFGNNPRFRSNYCDIGKRERILRLLHGVDYVFHTAALKHVPISEESPWAAIDVNVLGVGNVLDSCLEAGVRRVLFTSSDKAVNPTSVMGTSKLLGERIVSSANRRNNVTTTMSTRFGNVAGSRGSVIPLFCSQIRKGGPVTLTSEDMTRFFMTLPEAASLVIESMVYAEGGDIFITKMHTVRIKDVAEILIEHFAPRVGRNPREIELQIIGPRPAEKLYEELSTEEEMSRTYDADRFLIVRPVNFRHDPRPTLLYNQQLGIVQKVSQVYNSKLETPLSRSELTDYLLSAGLIPPS